MSLRRYNLNLLPVLDALLRHRSVTRAGQELGMSQSAASHALTRLRAHFKDELLVPAGGEMLLTHRAEVIAGALPDLLEIASRLLERDSFHPKHSVRTFKLGTADYVGLLLLPEITAKLPGVAPDIQMQLTWDRNDMPKKLRSGQLDFALMPRGTLDETDLHSETLFADELVVIVGAANPRVGDKLDLETFCALRHVSFRRENTTHKGFAEIQLAQARVSIHNILLVSDFLLMPFVVASTESAALVSRKMAERFAAHGIRIFPPPFPTDKLYIEAYWSHAQDSDQGHRWFRGMLRAAAERL